jgi:hypothetical protein
LEPGEYLDWVRTIATTLDFVHARGTIHRDVKPANVLFDEEGHVFLSDFGVAKAMQNEDANLTEAGTGIGSPRYMAPEQGYGRELTPAADQYALASMLYEAAAGRPPYLETSAIELLVKKSGSDPESLCDLVPALPAAAGDAVMRALSREPEGRHASCRAFIDAFEAGLRPEPDVQPEPVPLAREGSRRMLPALLLLLVAALAGVWIATRDDPAPTEQANGATNSAGTMRLTLIDAGAKPRRPLRYVVQPGAVERVSIVVHQDTTQTLVGNATPSQKSPRTRLGVLMRIDDVAKSGDISMSWTTAAVGYEEMEGVREEVRPMLAKLKQFYLKFAGRMVMAPNGLTRSSELTDVEDMPLFARRQLESIWWVVRNSAMPFPAEPIGVGARWEVSETVDLMGLRVTDTSTFELVRIDDDSFALKIVSAQTAAEQKLRMLEGEYAHLNPTLLSLHARGKGTGTADVRHVSPATFEYGLVMDMELVTQLPGAGGKEAEEVESEMRSELTLRVERTAGGEPADGD